MLMYIYEFVAVAWSVESLLSNPAARVRFPAGSWILISVLGLDVCPLSVFCPLLFSAEALILCWPHIQGSPPLCICLESMRNNLRQLPALTFCRTLAGILRGWDLTIERNEELHLWQSIRALFLSVSRAHSPTFPSLHLSHSSFSNPSFASPTSQALHLRHLANRPWRYG